MELLQRTSKQYLLLSFTILIVTMGLISCDCGGGKFNETAGALELNFEKDQLQDAGKQTKLLIKATKTTKLTGLKLVAKLTSNNPVDGVVKLTVRGTDHTVTIGTNFEPALYELLGLETEGKLTEGEEKTVDITFEPTSEKDLKLAIEVKNDKSETVGSAKTVEWKKNSAIVLMIASSKPFITGNEEATITVANNSTVAVTPSDVEVEFTLDTAAEFDLGRAVAKKNRDQVKLDAILADNTAIAAGARVTFKVKLSDAQGSNRSALSLMMIHHGEEAFAKGKVVEWRKDNQVIVLSVKSDKNMEGFKKANITISNDSQVAVIPADITVMLTVNNAATFDLGTSLGKATTNTMTLQDILGHNTPIAPNKGEATFKIKLSDAKNQKKSALGFTLSYQGYEVFASTKVVEWQAPVVKLLVTSDKDIKGTQESTITVVNKSKVAVKPATLEVEFRVDNAAEFDLGSSLGKKNRDKMTLENILGHDMAIVAGGAVTFKVKLNNAKTEKQSVLSFAMSHQGVEVFAPTKVVQWREKPAITLRVTSDKANIINEEEATIKVVNNSAVAVTPSDLEVEFTVDTAAEFDLGKAGAKKNRDQAKLDAILADNTAIAAGATVTFKVKLSDDKGSRKAEGGFRMSCAGEEVFVQTDVVKWEEIVKLEVTSDTEVIIDDQEATITLKNKSGIPVNPANVTVLLTTAGSTAAEFNLGVAKAKKSATKMSLQDILGNDTAIHAGKRVTFPVKVSNPKGDKLVSWGFMIGYKGINAFGDLHLVKWEATK